MKNMAAFAFRLRANKNILKLEHLDKGNKQKQIKNYKNNTAFFQSVIRRNAITALLLLKANKNNIFNQMKCNRKSINLLQMRLVCSAYDAIPKQRRLNAMTLSKQIKM